MKAKVTAWIACLCMSVALTLQAQPVRNGEDVVWARDVGDATITLDGVLDEAVWQQAEMIEFVWNDPPGGLPGSGQKIESNPVSPEPPDPNDGTLYILRDGNTLWLGIQVNDKSVGGGRALQAGNWDFDGFIVSMTDPSRRPDTWGETAGGWSTNSEFIYGWWHPADTSDATTTYDNGDLVGSGYVIPGIDPYVYGQYGVGWDEPMSARTEEDEAVWGTATVVDGIANDDTHGEDVGYTTEWRIDLAVMGYDMTQPGGDKVAFNFALQDTDYRWPADPDMAWTSRVWFQNQWGNNFSEGVGFIYGAPEVTVESGEVPEVTEPEVRIPAAGEELTIDGALDETAWTENDPQFQIQYQPSEEVLNSLPGITRHWLFFFRPDLNGEEPNPPVLDPSLGRVTMLSQGDMLYVGLDVDDQAINGGGDESSRDGLRISLRSLDSLTSSQTLFPYEFEFSVDSSGAVRYGGAALTMREEDPTTVEAAVTMKGSSTAADPSDIDEGYRLEIAIDLTKTLGYPAALGAGRVWFNLNFFDSDYFEDTDNNYSTRTWIAGERADGASIYGYLESSTGTSIEDKTELPGRIALLGNYPNPFNPTTTLRYALPQSGDVTIQVFDVLGRRVATLAPGMQAAGLNEARVDASSLASGVYLYRVQVASQTSGAVQASTVGRMILLK